jgi:serine/threonine protein kinase
VRPLDALTIGARLGPYEILGPIGRGGMGEVYRARDARLGREVAVKVLAAETECSPDRLARFERETRAVAALSHPNILAIHDIGNESGVVYAVMELLEGETLRDRLQQQRRITPLKAVEYAIQIARGLAAAHERGIVHRDLKPGTCSSPARVASRFSTSASRCRRRRPTRPATRDRRGS